METDDPFASVSLNFTGAAAVAINSMRDWGHWTYNVVSVISWQVIPLARGASDQDCFSYRPLMA